MTIPPPLSIGRRNRRRPPHRHTGTERAARAARSVRPHGYRLYPPETSMSWAVIQRHSSAELAPVMMAICMEPYLFGVVRGRRQ
ncbi:hypothetical protein GCM10007977_082740 [Dactylosporangium sucinum]|uniref:Uncharacterized protein n=1 Tax=Dactylosporangium sucinum TaxID=1424081 RepID=A0A917UB79_9ACTN|nr:hypothetical protein GCM10007977_082740 [Dactylosporangium sucinum]